jgi:tetratricopeptide (TPR) repeat protein
MGAQDEDIAAYREAARLLLIEGRVDDEATKLQRLIYHNLGFILSEKGDIDEAEAAYREVLRLQPSSPETLNDLGALLCDERQDYDGAVAAFRRAVELGVTEPEKTHSNLGRALGLKGDLAGAVAAYREAVRLAPADEDALEELGALYCRTGAWDEAVGALTEALRLKPDDAENLCMLGNALRQKGKYREALAKLRRGHELGSGDTEWSCPSAEWIKQCEWQLKLDEVFRRLAAVFLGAPMSAGEKDGRSAKCQSLVRTSLMP